MSNHIRVIPRRLPLVKDGAHQINKEERLNFLFGFIGTNRTGKTTTEKFLAMEWKEKNPDRPVMSFDPQLKLDDISDFKIDMSDPNFGDKICNLRNALLIIDDIKALHPKTVSDKWLLKFLQFRSEWSVDMMYTVHSPSLVVNILTHFTTHYFIFKTQTVKQAWSNKIPNYEQCMAASNYINSYVKIYGRGHYPKFPHIIVDNEKDSLTAQNMK